MRHNTRQDTLIATLLCGSLPTAMAGPVAVSKLGSGIGDVSSEKWEIVCGEDCNDEFPAGRPVQLTATPQQGSRFLSWAAGGCSGKSTLCDYKTITAPDTVAVYFTGAALAAGGYHTVALRSTDGSVWTWGRNDQGQLGEGTRTDQATPVRISTNEGPLSDVTIVTAGHEHSVVLQNGQVWAWGKNKDGQLGDGTTTQRLTPVPVANLTGVIALSAGDEHTVALTGGGEVWAWGNNRMGQLGDGTTTSQKTPVQVPIDEVLAIATGKMHTAALRRDGTVWMWGANNTGQLGNGNRSTTVQTKPVQVPKLSNVVMIDSGAYHTIALDSDGDVWVWGNNQLGQLGDSSWSDRLAPVKLARLDPVRAISAGYSHTAVLTQMGNVLVWGDNTVGQLCDGDTDGRPTPLLLQGVTGIQTLAAGATHTVLLKSDGSVIACGGNGYGTLGTGTIDSAQGPVAVTALNLSGDIYTLTIKKAGAGTGTVTGNGKFVANTSVTLKATPAVDSTFSGWSPSPCADSFTMPAKDLTCTATFAKKALPKLTVTATAGAGGTISPASRTVEKGKTAIFTVKPNSTYLVNTVAGCSGKLVGTTYTTGAITAACAVKATFKAKPVTKYAVTLKKIGTGTGTVSGAGSFAAGATVKLTATADAGSTFVDWNPSPCANSFSMPAKALTCTATFTKDTPIGPEMVEVEGGCFIMGSPEDELYRGNDVWGGDETLHEVCIDSFEMGKTEVTVGQFRQFVEATKYQIVAGCDSVGGLNWKNTGFTQTDNHPVVCVDWNAASAYTAWLSEKTGQHYRLPTEAEWEYAARAGTTTARHWESDDGLAKACVYANVADTSMLVAYPNWQSYFFCTDGYIWTAPVASFKPNALGLYDVLGNVFEWTCSDWSYLYDGTEAKCSANGVNGARAARGGSWSNSVDWVRSASRGFIAGTVTMSTGLGFRVAKSQK